MLFMKKAETETLILKVTPEMKNTLVELSDRQGVSLSKFVRQMLAFKIVGKLMKLNQYNIGVLYAEEAGIEYEK